MVGLSLKPSKSIGKQLAVSSEESDIDLSLGFKDILVKPEGVYWHTLTRTRMIAQVDYSLLARRIEVNNEHSAIVKSHFLNLSSETTVFAYMAGTPEEVAKQFKEQVWVQREQFDMIWAQQESSDKLKQILSQLIREEKKPKGKTLSYKSKSKWKERKSLSFTNTESEEHSKSKPPKSSS